jgi:hypothetical protein
VLAARISGADDYRRAARDLRRIRDRDLAREIRGGVKAAVDEEFPGLVRASAAAHVPSGYVNELVPSLRVTTKTILATSRGVGVQIRVWARGDGGSQRDVRSLNRGKLKKPVYGRSHRNKLGETVLHPWVAQYIPAGMVDRPLETLRPRIVRSVDGRLSRIADRFNNGG